MEFGSFRRAAYDIEQTHQNNYRVNKTGTEHMDISPNMLVTLLLIFGGLGAVFLAKKGLKILDEDEKCEHQVGEEKDTRE